MKKRLLSISLNSRQKMMVAVTIIVAIVALVLEQWTFPTYDRWRQQSSALHAKAGIYGRLSRNLSIKDSVNRQFARIEHEAFRSGPDEIMLADFLKRVETTAGPLLLKVEPSPAKAEGAYATFCVKLLVSGKLQEIVRFADELTRGSDTVGVESFSLRAIPGRNMCDCTFVLWTVRLSSFQQQPQTRPASIPATTSAPASAISRGAAYGR